MCASSTLLCVIQTKAHMEYVFHILCAAGATSGATPPGAVTSTEPAEHLLVLCGRSAAACSLNNIVNELMMNCTQPYS